MTAQTQQLCLNIMTIGIKELITFTTAMMAPACPGMTLRSLNYLNPEVREKIIQTILDVARNFPIIRFDAAMTLAKRHYQRLWYPRAWRRMRYPFTK